MKRVLNLIILAAIMAGCGKTAQKSEEIPQNAQKDSVEVNVKDKSFDELFTEIAPTDLTDNVFKLVGQDFTVITAGVEADYNSMTASWGGVGIMFNEPVTWCFLRASRYTLVYIQKEKKYTMSYFPERYKEDVLFFGSASGRDSDKMKRHKLTAVTTPEGSVSYKEARLIIECSLTEVTTVSPEDFYTEEGKTFVTDAFKEVKGWHKLVFGKITKVWVKK
ncbi:MAG: flavin reductase [Dysgonamonadaceae bacterium]|jgi:flavin reductase (DIM6/NTAB) family NADH-FMN oxidoreductase RutF|nr:flavin reductase [Dysgonamonadaceae bacterium]